VVLCGSNEGHKNAGGVGLALTLEHDAAMVPRIDKSAEEGHVGDKGGLCLERRLE
jgi:hypothetical protein